VSESPGKRLRRIHRLLYQGMVWPDSEEEALARDLRDIYRSPFWRGMMRGKIHALLQGNPLPLRKELKMRGPMILADLVLQVALQRLWSEKVLDTPEGEQARKSIDTLFNNLGDPLGRPEKPKAIKQEGNRQRQQQSREKDAQSEQTLRNVIEEAKARLPIQHNWQRRRKEAAAIEDELIAQAMESTDPHERKAGKKLKKLIDRERVPFKARNG
jgi:hypothetical protein